MPDDIVTDVELSDVSETVTGHIGFEEFTEDLFGLNIRSAKTIWQSFKSPQSYFEAARTADWKQTYTPSLRLWLGLTAIMVALQFFWQKPDGAFMQTMETGLRSGIEPSLQSRGREISLDGFDFQSALLDVFQLHTLIYPFIFVALMSILALVYRAWGERLPYVVRQRYIFAILVPASVIGVTSTLLMTFISGPAYQLMGYAQLLLILAFYFLTAYRGPYAQMETGARVGRSLAVSVCILAMVMVAQMISITTAMFTKFFPPLRDYIVQTSSPG